MIRGFGFTPVEINGDDPEVFQQALLKEVENPFYVLKTEKGATGPNRHQEAHQIPLKNPATDEKELKQLEEWLKSYKINELIRPKETA